MKTATCEDCFRKYNMDFVMKQAESYKCIVCGTPYVRPDVILFGENVTAAPEAFKIAKTTDLLLVLGTSLQVYPVADIPKKIKYSGHMVIINYADTDFDYKKNTIKISSSIGETLTKINELIGD
jgi:NAD-dependent deacetylase